MTPGAYDAPLYPIILWAGSINYPMLWNLLNLPIIGFAHNRFKEDFHIAEF